jgi:hypothetical protein
MPEEPTPRPEPTPHDERDRGEDRVRPATDEESKRVRLIDRGHRELPEGEQVWEIHIGRKPFQDEPAEGEQ